jgi:hypothetical protein
MTNPFDIVKNLTGGGQNLMRDTENDELAEKGYPAFMVNRALSYMADAVFVANMMNENHHLDGRPQYEFLKSAVRPKKRPFTKWAKVEKNETINILMEHYECNRRIAEQYAKLLTEEQLTQIKKEKEKGGRDNGR